MLKKLFCKQKEALDYFYSHLDLAKCEELFEWVKGCDGVLFFTGIGKSGLIAQKIAATLMSTGTKAFFLPPIDALHGDLAMVSQKDMLFCLSKSGESDELLQLLPYVRNKGVKIIALTSNPSSRLTRAADFSLHLPLLSELCPFDLAPTLSTTLQLLIGDVLVVALMREKSYSVSDFAKNHPGGSIGKRSSIRVSDLMLDESKTPLCLPEATLQDALLDFTEKRCGCLVVVDKEKRLKGIFTDGDLRRALQERGEGVLKEKLEKLMVSSPKAISVKSMAVEALKMMESDQNHPIMVLPVLDEKNQVKGLIKMHDLVQSGF